MTLILTCLTADFIYQVSDRRLTRLSDGELITDHRNKAVLVCGATVLAYTGLADIAGGTPVDQWIAQKLLNEGCTSVDCVTEVLKARATEAFHDLPLSPVKKRHAFVGASWVRKVDGGELIPLYFHVSNALSEHGRWRSGADEQFSVHYQVGMGRKSFVVISSGAALSTIQLRQLDRSVGEAIGNRVGPQRIVDLLALAIREAASSNAAIGANLMAIALPRAAIQSGQSLQLSAAATSDAVTFEYLTGDASEAIQFGPISVCGRTGARDFTFEPASPTNRADGSVSITLMAAQSLDETVAELKRLHRTLDEAEGDHAKKIAIAQRILRKLNGRRDVPPIMLQSLVIANIELGRAYGSLGNYEDAIKASENALTAATGFIDVEAFWHSVVAMGNIIVAHRRAGSPERSVEACDRLIDAYAHRTEFPRANLTEEALILAFGARGRDLARQYSFALRSRALSLLDVGSINEARQAAVDHDTIFANASDSVIQQHSSELAGCR